MGDIKEYPGMLGGAGARPGRQGVGRGSSSTRSDTSVKDDGYLPVRQHLQHVFPDAENPMNRQSTDGVSSPPGSLGWALNEMSTPFIADTVSQAQADLQAAENALQGLQGGSGGGASDDGAGSLVHDGEYFFQNWWGLTNKYNFQWQNYGGTKYPSHDVSFYTSAWAQEPLNQATASGYIDENFPSLTGYPGLCEGGLASSLMRAAALGNKTMMVQGTGNVRWVARYYANLIRSRYGSGAGSGSSGNAALLATLAAKVHTLRQDTEKVRDTIKRLEVETVGGMTALGVGEVYAAGWFAALLAQLVAEVTALITSEGIAAIGGMAERAAGVAAGQATMTEKLVELHTAIGSPNNNMIAQIQEQLTVTLADGTRQKLAEFFDRLVIEVGGVKKNLLAECYVKDNAGKVRTMREALQGLVFTVPDDGSIRHALLHLIGLEQPNISPEPTP